MHTRLIDESFCTVMYTIIKKENDDHKANKDKK